MSGVVFPFGQIGYSTESELICGWCKGVHNKGIDVDMPGSLPGYTVYHVKFGDLVVADCCFADLESAVLSSMPGIVLWLEKLLDQKQKEVDNLRIVTKRGIAAVKELC